MKRVIVVFEVDDEHNIEERERELTSELQRVQENSEVGLVLDHYEIHDCFGL